MKSVKRKEIKIEDKLHAHVKFPHKAILQVTAVIISKPHTICCGQIRGRFHIVSQIVIRQGPTIVDMGLVLIYRQGLVEEINRLVIIPQNTVDNSNVVQGAEIIRLICDTLLEVV